jgi:hypothetical protein
MEAASRPSLELLPDLPLEQPLEQATQRQAPPAAASPAPPPVPANPGAAPPKDPAQTGITFLDPAALVLEGAAPAEPALSGPAPPVVQAASDTELVMEDPAVLEELLTAPPPPPKPPVAAPASSNTPSLTPESKPVAAAVAPAAEARAEVRVPIIKTASLSAAATKAAATKLAAAGKRVGEGIPKPVMPPAPTARPAPSPPPAPAAAPAVAKVMKPAATPVPGGDGLAGWTNARAAAAPAAKPKSSPQPAAAAAASPPKNAADKTAPSAATPSTAAGTPPAAPMDRDFIARNQVVERYLSGRLPLRGATEFEQFVSKHPEILDEIGLPERVNAGLRLLEASGKPEPWQEAPRPAWQKPQVTLALAAIAAVLAVALMVVAGTGASKNHKIAELTKQAVEQPLDPATSTREIRLMPSRSGASNAPAITIGSGGAQLADFKIDESRSPYHIFRVTIDRIDQGRVGVITNLVKDSNGHLRIALNSTALGPGNYQLTIEGLNWRGDPEPDSWVTIGVAR